MDRCVNIEGMGMVKDSEGAHVVEMAIKGWLAYVQEVTKHEDPAMPVDERMAVALPQDVTLPHWLEDAVRVRLVAARGEVLVQRALSRTSG
jgi:hypothetical protein